MKFLLFEWMIGGGLIESGHSPDFRDPFFTQGSAMFAALAEDLLASGHSIIAPIDPRSSQAEHFQHWTEKQDRYQPVFVHADLSVVLQRLASQADQIVLIAPESAGILSQCYCWLSDWEKKWFGGPLDWIALASNKNSMQTYLKANGIPVPSSQIGAGQGWVAKPADGAGSEDVQIFSERDRLEEFQQSDDWRTERYVAGKSVSVSIIKIHGECFFLPPSGQIFADGTVADGAVIGHYVGTEFPLEEDFARRAETLAKQTVAILPEFSGYIGIDMILADTGSDVVIEINPRMTMSYCHLPLELRSRWLKATAT